MTIRELGPRLIAMAKKMPVISITGPRQSGKTTLARYCFPDYHYVNLENPELRGFALNDPISFLQSYPGPVIIDEAQYAPELFSYIQVITDASGRNGQFILTGSQNFMLLEKIGQSLAGRVSLFNLLPLSIAELKNADKLTSGYEEIILNGFYPRLYDNALLPAEFYPSYISSYVERDVRQIIQVKNLSIFHLFLKLCAGYAGQILNMHALANDLGVDHKTIRQWIGVLEVSFIIFLLKPHYRNYNKRIIKSPKLYFNDTGLAASLLGIETVEQLHSYFQKGALFENLIIADIYKNILNTGRQPALYFWRDNTGHKVDLLLEQGTITKPIEIKSGRTFQPGFLRGLQYYDRLSGARPQESYLVYGGDMNAIRNDIHVINWEITKEITE